MKIANQKRDVVFATEEEATANCSDETLEAVAMIGTGCGEVAFAELAAGTLVAGTCWLGAKLGVVEVNKVG